MGDRCERLGVGIGKFAHLLVIPLKEILGLSVGVLRISKSKIAMVRHDIACGSAVDGANVGVNGITKSPASRLPAATTHSCSSRNVETMSVAG